VGSLHGVLRRGTAEAVGRRRQAVMAADVRRSRQVRTSIWSTAAVPFLQGEQAAGILFQVLDAQPEANLF